MAEAGLESRAAASSCGQDRWRRGLDGAVTRGVMHAVGRSPSRDSAGGDAASAASSRVRVAQDAAVWPHAARLVAGTASRPRKRPPSDGPHLDRGAGPGLWTSSPRWRVPRRGPACRTAPGTPCCRERSVGQQHPSSRAQRRRRLSWSRAQPVTVGRSASTPVWCCWPPRCSGSTPRWRWPPPRWRGGVVQSSAAAGAAGSRPAVQPRPIQRGPDGGSVCGPLEGRRGPGLGP